MPVARSAPYLALALALLWGRASAHSANGTVSVGSKISRKANAALAQASSRKPKNEDQDNPDVDQDVAQGDTKATKEDPEVVQDDAKVVEGNPDELQDSAKVVQGNPDELQEDAVKVMKGNLDELQEDAVKVMKERPDVVQDGMEVVKEIPEIVQDDVEVVKKTPTGVQDDMEVVKENADMIKDDVEVVEDDAPKSDQEKVELELITELNYLLPTVPEGGSTLAEALKSVLSAAIKQARDVREGLEDPEARGVQARESEVTESMRQEFGLALGKVQMASDAMKKHPLAKDSDMAQLARDHLKEAMDKMADAQDDMRESDGLVSIRGMRHAETQMKLAVAAAEQAAEDGAFGTFRATGTPGKKDKAAQRQASEENDEELVPVIEEADPDKAAKKAAPKKAKSLEGSAPPFYTDVKSWTKIPDWLPTESTPECFFTGNAASEERATVLQGMEGIGNSELCKRFQEIRSSNAGEVPRVPTCIEAVERKWTILDFAGEVTLDHWAHRWRFDSMPWTPFWAVVLQLIQGLKQVNKVYTLESVHPKGILVHDETGAHFVSLDKARKVGHPTDELRDIRGLGEVILKLMCPSQTRAKCHTMVDEVSGAAAASCFMEAQPACVHAIKRRLERYRNDHTIQFKNEAYKEEFFRVHTRDKLNVFWLDKLAHFVSSTMLASPRPAGTLEELFYDYWKKCMEERAKIDLAATLRD